MSTTTEHIDAVRRAIRNFEAIQSSLREFGARDTEPDGKFQSRVYRAAKGLRPDPPHGVAGWELFHMKGADEAAKSLTDACAAVIEAIEACPIGEQDELRSFVADYCWRVY